MRIVRRMGKETEILKKDALSCLRLLNELNILRHQVPPGTASHAFDIAQCPWASCVTNYNLTSLQIYPPQVLSNEAENILSLSPRRSTRLSA